MTTKNNFLEEIKALENILKQANQVFELEKEEYEKILESISRGGNPRKINRKYGRRHKNRRKEQSLFLVQRLAQQLLTEEEHLFVIKYKDFFSKNRKIKDYAEYLSYPVSVEKVLLTLLYIFNEILIGKRYTDITINLAENLYSVKYPNKIEALNYSKWP